MKKLNAGEALAVIRESIDLMERALADDRNQTDEAQRRLAEVSGWLNELELYLADVMLHRIGGRGPVTTQVTKEAAQTLRVLAQIHRRVEPRQVLTNAAATGIDALPTAVAVLGAAERTLIESSVLTDGDLERLTDGHHG